MFEVRQLLVIFDYANMSDEALFDIVAVADQLDDLDRFARAVECGLYGHEQVRSLTLFGRRSSIFQLGTTKNFWK